jgi:hypothetical protein
VRDIGYPNAAFPSRYTECPGGAYGRCDGAALRPGFADQRFRHIQRTLRSALFPRVEAVRIGHVSFVTSN